MPSQEYYLAENDIYDVGTYSRSRNGNSSMAERRIEKFPEPSALYNLRILTIINDVLLMGCSIYLFIIGWHIYKINFDVFDVIDVAQISGKTVLTFGSIYITLALFGIWGAGGHKACFISVHNIGLLLTLVANGLIIICIDKYYEKLFELDCAFDIDGISSNIEKCCCDTVKGQRCWKYNGDLSSSNKSCNVNLHEKADLFKERAHYFVPASMVMQALAMIFGYLVITCKNRYNKFLLRRATAELIINEGIETYWRRDSLY